MEKTCKEAYNIFCQYEKITPIVRKEVKYVLEVIATYSSKPEFQFNDLVALSRYISTTLSEENLNVYEQQAIMKQISLLRIVSWSGAPELVNRMVDYIIQIVLSPVNVY